MPWSREQTSVSPNARCLAIAALALASILLSACGLTGHGEQLAAATLGDAAVTEPRHALPIPRPRPPELASVRSTRRAVSDRPATRESVAPDSDETDAETEPQLPAQVVGLTPADLAAAFGPPDREEDEAPSRVWHYARAGCSVSVFFFLDLATETFRALHVDVSNGEEATPDGDRDTAVTCLVRPSGEGVV